MLEEIGTDLHLHVIPNIDDGSRSIEESLQIVASHYESGIRRIIATPHIRSDRFLNKEAGIQAAFVPLAEKVAHSWPDLKFSFAAEYFADDYFSVLLEKAEIMPLFENYVLVETSMREEQPHFVAILQKMFSQGWKPVLAHPERYRTWWDAPKIYDQLYEMGVIFQVNLLSLAGKYGPKEQEIAEILISQGKIKAVGSDLHRASQYMDILKATKNPYFSELCQMPLLNRNEI